jgi:pimeloyl-ACP methyl ester carboxylesterase
MGGAVAITLAALRPHRALLERLLGNGWVTRVATFRACSPLGLYRSAVGLVEGTQPIMRERLYAFRIPRAYLFGERGLPDPDTERLASQGIQVLVVPNAGHDMVVDNPAGLAERTAQALQVTASGP